MSRSHDHRSLAVLVLVLATMVPANALGDLVAIDLADPGDGLITLDTRTGLEWLDLTRTAGLSIDAVRIDFGGLPNGRVATEAEVIGLFESAGVVEIDGTCPENEPGVSLLLDLMGVTFVEISGGIGALALHDGGGLYRDIVTRARLRVGPQEVPLGTAETEVDLVTTHAEFPDTGIFVVSEVAVSGPAAVDLAGARLRASPNPFNPMTVIEFVMPESAVVELVVYDVRGRRIRTLVHDVQAPGRQQVVWDGRDEAGRDLASGAYLVRLHSPVFDRPDVTRAVLVR